MHRFIRFGCVLALVAGCGKTKNDHDTGAAVSTGSASASTGSAGTAGPATVATPDKAPPPAESRKGDSRVVNLLLDEAGKPSTVDVWGKRSFEWGPLQFAKALGYGQSTPHFGIPKGMSTVIVPTGADPHDRKQEMGWVWASQAGGGVTTGIYRDEGQGRSIVMGMKPAELHNAPAAPPAGKGLIYIYAGPLRVYEAKLTEKYGGSAFYVGDGSTTCLRQRLEDKGQQPAILGGTNATSHDVAPGKTKVTLHKWEPGNNCTTPPVAELDVDVADGKGTFVILHSPDAGGTISALQLPMWK